MSASPIDLSKYRDGIICILKVRTGTNDIELLANAVLQSSAEALDRYCAPAQDVVLRTIREQIRLLAPVSVHAPRPRKADQPDSSLVRQAEIFLSALLPTEQAAIRMYYIDGLKPEVVQVHTGVSAARLKVLLGQFRQLHTHPKVSAASGSA